MSTFTTWPSWPTASERWANLESELMALSRQRIEARGNGAKPPGPVDEDRLKRDREDNIVAARVGLIKFCDATLGAIREGPARSWPSWRRASASARSASTSWAPRWPGWRPSRRATTSNAAG